LQYETREYQKEKINKIKQNPLDFVARLLSQAKKKKILESL
jgi:hypothetical protein